MTTKSTHKPSGQNPGRSATLGTALVTGASSGIGEVLAQRCAAAGYNLVLVARSADKLKALAASLTKQHGVSATVNAADLAQAGAPVRLAASLKRQKRTVDLLINCAGVLQQGTFGTMGNAEHQGMIDLNISALTAMLTAFLPGMVKQGSGRVLNVASIAAFQPIPTLATYAATKAYVLSLSESLAEELRDTGVTITTLCPGITATNMLKQASGSNQKLNELPGFLIGDVQDVAAQGLAACLRGDAICVPGAVNQAAVIASRSIPKWLVRRIGGLIGRTAL